MGDEGSVGRVEKGPGRSWHATGDDLVKRMWGMRWACRAILALLVLGPALA